VARVLRPLARNIVVCNARALCGGGRALSGLGVGQMGAVVAVAVLLVWRGRVRLGAWSVACTLRLCGGGALLREPLRDIAG